MNEQAFIDRVEAANTQELIQILTRPSADEDRVLRIHLGADRYERLRHLALRSGRRGAKKGNVVVLHGIMGGELTVMSSGKPDHIWMKFTKLIFGGAKWLKMQEDGTSAFDVRATGILKKWYSELLLGLAQEWNVQAFWFDWRRDLTDSADKLREAIDEWFGPTAPVHLVGHSMGGLVSRTFILRHAERWKRAWDSENNGLAGGRLVMLGTPNHGSFAIPQICTGTEESVKKLVIADLKHSASELVGIVNTFPGSYQMLPSLAVMPAMEPLYRAETYGSFAVPQALLDNARQHHEKLAPIVDRDRMVYIAGYNKRTYDDIRDMSGLRSIDAYSTSMNGDGTVPHRLGFLERDGKRIPTYFVDAQHGALPNDPGVIAATLTLLETGKCSLPEAVPALARSLAKDDSVESAERVRLKMEEMRLKEIAVRARMRTRGPDADDAPVTPEEKEGERLILRSFLADASAGATALPDAPIASTPRTGRGRPKTAAKKGSQPVAPLIEIALMKGGIESVAAVSHDGHKVDAIAVGHYLGVKPQAAEQKLDEAISAAYRRRENPSAGANGVSRGSEMLLTLFTERGIVRGDLGQPFILPDPRDPARLIVLAGMGVPGHFGVPELTVLAQELCWSMGRLQKRHLATVLIGAGSGNLSIEDAVGGWLRGIRRALASSDEDIGRQLRRITFVEHDARTLRLLDRALRAAIERGDSALRIAYRGPNDTELAKARVEARDNAVREAEKEFDREETIDDADELVPVRITVGLERKTYQFAAITQQAAVPQRDIPLDPRLVCEANDELARAKSDDQLQCGRFLERLLIPHDIRGRIYTPAPIVLMLDSTTARVHWEMIARSDALATRNSRQGEIDDFLGTRYGLTRQLRTTFAPPPEAPPPPKRTIKVLIVADPAEDAPLPGAQAEAEEVAKTFQSFNEIHSERTGHSIEVVTLFGPGEAKRTTVLKKLMLENFDVLHFAGHCVYDEEDPANSGWLFSLKNDERLTANELKRIDRVPNFVFSNACESGITPDRSDQRNAAMAPSFAEAFFARGVANFVCTAWPVDDEAARVFARRLYGELLGLPGSDGFAYMHAAMREARRAIATDLGGSRTWGAYQHYGNPYFRFFQNAKMRLGPELTVARELVKTVIKKVPKLAASTAPKLAAAGSGRKSNGRGAVAGLKKSPKVAERAGSRAH
jgi:pimeloyl-ACP methyl ester carboxylesterase